MNNDIDLRKYITFVDGVTSEASKDPDVFIARINEMSEQSINLPRLITAGIGLSGEAGEFAEIVKKISFHGKEFTPEVKQHLKKELGDVIWYWTQACIALEEDPNTIISENVAKLETRYPGGKFNPFLSNNRAEGDI